MVIHGEQKQWLRMASLDTGADLDVVSHQVVKDLGLQTEKYEGVAFTSLGGCQPESQITLSWHVQSFPKTYTTTFALIDKEYSKDFDVLLGRFTIEKIGFYRKVPELQALWLPPPPIGTAERRVIEPHSTLLPGVQDDIGSRLLVSDYKYSKDRDRASSSSGVVRNEKVSEAQLPGHNIAGNIYSSTENPQKASTDLVQDFQPPSARELDQWQHSYDADADKAIMITGPSFSVIQQRFRNTCKINVSHVGRLINTPLTAVLDTTFDINLIDSTIVDEFGLTKIKRQRNKKNFNSDSFTATGWEVLIDWHVIGFEKQYNDTFLVVNRKASSGYENNVILGRDTIREVGFFPDAVEAPSEAPSLITGSTLSTASVEGFQEAAEDIAELLFQDPVLNPLYHKALGVFKINEFERKFAKLLRGFASELRTESINEIHQKAVRFLKTRTNLIISHIGHRLDPEKTDLAQCFQQLATQKPKQIMQSDALETNDIVELELAELAASSNFGSSESEVPENAYLYHREQVRSFILHSTALLNLRESFGRLVLQSHFEVKSSADATPDSTLTVEEGFTPTLESPSKDDEDESAEPIDAPSTRVTLNKLCNFFSANTGRCIQLMFRIAEFLELREKPLRPGHNRIRWNCVCGAPLYDDFHDVSNDSLRALQRMLDNYKRISWWTASGSSVQEAPESVGSSITGNPSSGSQDSTTIVTTGFNEGQEYGTTRDQRSTGLRHRGYSNNNTETMVESQTWVLPIYHSERYRMKVEHLDVQKTKSDFEMFRSIKKRYHESKSTTKRLLAMRGVKDIKFVKFMHARQEPDICPPQQPPENWPPKERCPPWDYEGCRTGQSPQVGAAHLLHQWRNPSHSDAVTYWSQARSLVERLRFKLRSLRVCVVEKGTNLLMTATSPPQSGNQADGDAIPDEEAAATVETVDDGSSGLQNAYPYCYIILRTPKKLGEPLIADDRATPEAWVCSIQFFVKILAATINMHLVRHSQK
ncbi:MAG: hypothetical protein Q9192_006164 [Flavoplaca navasiana]